MTVTGGLDTSNIAGEKKRVHLRRRIGGSRESTLSGAAAADALAGCWPRVVTMPVGSRGWGRSECRVRCVWDFMIASFKIII